MPAYTRPTTLLLASDTQPDMAMIATTAGAFSDDELIFSMATHCMLRFSARFEKMLCDADELYAGKLRKLQHRFNCWAFSLGIFPKETGTLDQRLRHYPSERSFVVRLLERVSDSLIETCPPPGESDGDWNRRLWELERIEDRMEEMDRTAVWLRGAYTSHIPPHLKLFKQRKCVDVMLFEDMTKVAVDNLYPYVSHFGFARLIETMTERFTRLSYYKWAHDKKLRAKLGRHENRQGNLTQTQQEPQPSPTIRPPQPNASEILINFKDGEMFPIPPEFGDGEDEKRCPLCRKRYSKAKFKDVRWWR